MQVMQALAWYIAFVFSATLHEAAHAWVAFRGGDPTAYTGGQVTLDPLPHIRREPFGMVLLPLVSVFLIGWPFGYASAPYDPLWAARHPHRAARMALAGPASNFALLLISVGLIWCGIWTGHFSVPDQVTYSSIVEPNSPGVAHSCALLLSVVFTLNLVMTILNLIPLPPLDGGSVVGLFVSEEKAAQIQRILANPSFGLLGLMLAWRVFDPVFHVAFRAVVSLIYPGTYT